MAAVVPISFSEDGGHLIFSSPDGVLKLWDTSSGILKQEYTPSSHLAASCSCLSWGPSKQTHELSCKKKRRKSKDGSGESVIELGIIAVGTTSGDIFLYSTTKGDVHSYLKSGHSSLVNGICWSIDGSALYSCSNDCNIIEWDATSAKVKHKWKADKSSVYSVCLCSSNHLLSAGRIIKLWDLTTKIVLQKFTGHSTEVFRLLSISHFRDNNDDSLDNTYFLSAALNDRIVNVWNINTSSRKDNNCVASFSLPDEPVTLNISKRCTKHQSSLLLSVVTKRGKLLIFEHTLNGHLSKPVQPKVTLQIAPSNSKDDVYIPISVLASFICDDKDNSILLCYGNFLKPCFEKIPYDASNSEVCLVRDDPSNRSYSKTETSVTNVKTPQISKDVTVLAPGSIAAGTPSQDAGKRRKRKQSLTDMTIEERVNAISLDVLPGKSTPGPPKADGLARLLTQGLQSSDKRIINNVLQQRDETIIKNTVQKLPVQLIIPLVRELSQKLHGHCQSGQTYIKWIKTVLSIHTSFLMTFPEVVDLFSTLYEMMDSRTATFTKLSKLQGKLDLMLSQITCQTEEEDPVTTQQPLLMFQDESSCDEADEIEMVDLLHSQTDSEENWEELSDGENKELSDVDMMDGMEPEDNTRESDLDDSD